MDIKIRLLTDSAVIPTSGSKYSAGYDLYADEDVYIEANKTVKISTGIAMEIPNGCFGGIYARSGLATKQGLRPSNCVGVVDSDYRGEIIVALHNDSDQLRHVEKGDRIAQLIIQPFVSAEFVKVEKLEDTERGNGGFGSSGK